MEAPPSLRLSFLGTSAVRLDDQTLLPFRSVRMQALLAYLTVEKALTGSHKAPRDLLMALLWPEMPEPSARQNLRQTLYLLRRAIPAVAARASPQAVPLLLGDRQTVAINPDASYDLDVARLQQAVAHHDPAGLEEAVQHYRGPLLADFYLEDSNPFEEWAAARRSHLWQQAAAAFAALLEHYEAQQAWVRLEAAGGQWQRLDPLAEPPRRALMLARAHLGKWSQALAEYRAYAGLLDEELGVAPSPALDDLYQQIKHRRLGTSAAPPAPLPGAEPLPSPLQRHLPLTPLVGRQDELAQLERYLAHEGRLITITGPGGAGKTRLALAAGSQHASFFRDGVFFVPLETVDSPDRMASAIAAALGHAFHGPDPLFRQLGRFLARKRLLLILDNLEQLLGAARDLLALLQDAPEVTILVTSQERLNLPGEWLLSLTGLALAAEGLPAQGAAAVQLFVTCARRVAPDFELTAANSASVTRICRLLHGMPLGIELAAAWTRMLPAATIAREIEQNLDFVQNAARTTPDRHRSLRAVFNYMWQRLDEEERQLLQQLTVFRGGFSPQAAAHVAGAGLHALAGLVDKSLLFPLHGGSDGRYEMHLPLRQFAQEKLEEVQAEERVAQAHASYYATLAAEQGRLLRGGNLPDVLATLALEIDNLRAAWRWAVDRQRPALLQQMLEPLLIYYELRSWFQEGLEQFALLRESLEPAQTAEVRQLAAYAAAGQGWFALRLAENEQACSLFEQSLQLLEPLADDRAQAFVLSAQALALNNLGQYEDARRQAEASLALCAGLQDRFFKAFSLHNLGSVARMQSDFVAARRHYRDALELFRSIGHTYGVAFSLRNLALVHSVLGQWQEARHLLRESRDQSRRIGYRYGLSAALRALAEVLTALGDYERALALGEEALTLSAGLGDRDGTAWATLALAGRAAAAGEEARAAPLYRQSRDLFGAVGHRYGMGLAAAGLARLTVPGAGPAAAVHEGERSLALFRHLDNRLGVTVAQVALGYATLAHHGRRAPAASYFTSALSTALEMAALPLLLDGLLGAAHVLLARDKLQLAMLLAQAAAENEAATETVRRQAGRLLAKFETEKMDDATPPLPELVATALGALKSGE